MNDRDREIAELLGLSWGEFGKGFMGGAHVAGRVLATAFGGRALADQAEGLENRGGLLPDWAKKGGAADVLAVPDGAALQMSSAGAMKGGAGQSKVNFATFTTPAQTSAESVATVEAPDFVVVLRHGAKQADPAIAGLGSLVVTGAKRFDGNGWQKGDDRLKKFSFGFDAPAKVDFIAKDGKKKTSTDIKGVLVYGGTEQTATRVAGIAQEMDMKAEDFKVLGDRVASELSDGWTEIVGDTAGDFTVGDYCVLGADVIGAVAAIKPALLKQPLGITLNKSPAGRLHTMINVTPHKATAQRGVIKKQRDDATTVANAKTVGKRGVSVGNRVLKQIATAAKKTAVHGLAAPARPVARGRRTVSASQVKKLAEDLVKEGKDHISRGEKYGALAAANKQRVKTGATAAAEKMRPRPAGTSVKGLDETDVIGSGAFSEGGVNYEVVLGRAVDSRDLYDVIVGEVLLTDPDPLNPGFLVDGSPAPGYGAAPGAASSASAVPATGEPVAAPALPGPEENYGLPPPPTLADAQKAFLEPGTFASEAPSGDQSTYNTLPAGAIPYTWDAASRVPGFKDVTSYSTWHGQFPNAPGGVDGDGVPAGFEWHGDAGSKWWVYWPANGSSNNVSPPNKEEAASTDVMFDASLAKHWGPLVGKPGSHDWEGLRYLRGTDASGAKWFWFRDKAPEWATAPEIQKLLNQMVTDYQTQLVAAKQNYVAQAAQDLLDTQEAARLAKQNAKDDLAIQRQQATDVQAAQHQAEVQAMQSQTQSQAMDTQYQQQQLQQQAAQQQYAQQQAQLDVQERQQMLDFYKQNPQAMFQGPTNADEEQANDEQGVDWGDSGNRGLEDRSYEDIPADALFEDV